MERMLPLLAASSIFLAVPSWAQDVHLTRPYVSPKQNVTVPVTKLPGNYIGCIIVPTPSMRALTGLVRVHAVACVEATTGEVIVAVLRKNGTLFVAAAGTSIRTTRVAPTSTCAAGPTTTACSDGESGEDMVMETMTRARARTSRPATSSRT